MLVVITGMKIRSRGISLQRDVKTGRRYETDGLVEAQYQPRSHGRVLRNLLGIAGKREMDRTELAEQLRTMAELVDLTKGGFTFAAAVHLPRLMADFEKSTLSEYTPCKSGSVEAIIRAISVVHTELVLIHPFREGNGRVARMMASLMSLQAGLPALDFGSVRARERQEYFAAVQAGVGRDYRPMERIFTSVIRRTSRKRD